MKRSLFAPLVLAGLFLAPAPLLRAQNSNSILLGNGPGQGTGAFTINAINVSTPKTPEYNTQAGDATTKKYTLGTWLEIEVDFASGARASEVALHYSVLIGNTMLVGDQTLVDVPAGRNLFTIAFVAPKTLTTLLRGAPLTPTSVQNIDVQILRPGVSMPLANKMLRDGPAFYNTMQQVPGFVLNKAQTPFAPLWYDRYEGHQGPVLRPVRTGRPRTGERRMEWKRPRRCLPLPLPLTPADLSSSISLLPTSDFPLSISSHGRTRPHHQSEPWHADRRTR